MREIKIGGSFFHIESDDVYLSAMGADFEPHMVALFKALVSPEDIVADIGANIGMTALLFANLAQHTYAFEPSPTTFSLLKANLDRNGASNVTAVNLGLGSAIDHKSLTYAANNRSGGFVNDKMKIQSGHVTEEIKITTLDDFCSSHDTALTFLKLDVEGFEMSVIKGGLDYLQKHRPTVVMEMNHFCLNVLQRICLPDFLDFMRGVFPYLYAVEGDNSEIADLQQANVAYRVMHGHVISGRYPNIVGGFSPELLQKLKSLQSLQPLQAAVPPKTFAAAVPQMQKTPASLGQKLRARILRFL